MSKNMIKGASYGFFPTFFESQLCRIQSRRSSQGGPPLALGTTILYRPKKSPKGIRAAKPDCRMRTAWQLSPEWVPASAACHGSNLSK